MKRVNRESKFKVGDEVWCELNGPFTAYRHVMHPGKVEEVIEERENFRYLIYLTYFERRFKTSFDTFDEYKIFHPEMMVPFDEKLHEGDAFWFKVVNRKVDGLLVEGGKEVYLKGIFIKITKDQQVECLFDPCDARENWEKTTVPKENVYRNKDYY